MAGGSQRFFESVSWSFRGIHLHECWSRPRWIGRSARCLNSNGRSLRFIPRHLSILPHKGFRANLPSLCRPSFSLTSHGGGSMKNLESWVPQLSFLFWGCGAVGSARDWQSRGRGFESLQLHQEIPRVTPLQKVSHPRIVTKL